MLRHLYLIMCVSMFALMVSCGSGTSSAATADGSYAVSQSTVFCQTNQDCLTAMKVSSNAMCDTVNFVCLYWDSTVSSNLTYTDAVQSCSGKSTTQTPWRLPAAFELEELCGTAGTSCNLASGILNENPLNTGNFWATNVGYYKTISFVNANENAVSPISLNSVRCVYTLPAAQ